MIFEMKQIGVMHSPYKTKKECPVQFASKPDGRGIVEVFPEYAEGLKDIEGFSHIIVFYCFDRAGDVQLVRKPFLDDDSHGIFATRHPCRPNPIGISIVSLLERKDNILNIKGVDVLDGTPLLDVKPYVPKFDDVEGAIGGWVDPKPFRPKPDGRE